MNSVQKLIAAFAVLKLATIACLVLLFVLVLSGQDDARRASCRDTRTLVSTIVLRGVGTTYPAYRRNPERTLQLYGRSLRGNAFFRAHPDLIRRSVEQTRQSLALADPDGC